MTQPSDRVRELIHAGLVLADHIIKYEPDAYSRMALMVHGLRGAAFKLEDEAKASVVVPRIDLEVALAWVPHNSQAAMLLRSCLMDQRPQGQTKETTT